MEKMSIQDYMSTRWQEQYDYHQRKAATCKRNYHYLRVVEIVLAAAIPYLNTVAADNEILNHIVSVKGIVISVVAGIMLLYKFHERWIEHRLTSESLKNERVLFLVRAGIYKAENRDEKFVERIERILTGETKEWGKDHEEQEAGK